MRQGQQQHRRGRNRSNNNNNNRKGQNPLTRNFESSGPDVKIRGTPAHVAEKYMSLARDALSAGDPVLAENYLQHAEHYNRIILAFREQQNLSAEAQNGTGRQRESNEDTAEASNGDAGGDDQGRLVQPGDPQPSVSGGDAPKGERTEGRRPPQRARSSRDSRGSRAPREPRDGDDGSAQQREPRRRERQRFGESDQQPDFLRRPVRRTKSEDGEPASESGDSPAPAAADAAPDQE